MRVNPEKKEEKERVAHALLRVTLQLAATHGFVSLGLREVSRAADIAPTSFYRHFADMEELGLVLIEDLAGPFVRGWTEHPASKGTSGRAVAESVAHRALAAAAQDPELMRFILAERMGAIATFRAALERQLAAVSGALQAAFGTEHDGARRESLLADAVVVLVLEACGKVLDVDPKEAPALGERLKLQIRMLLDVAAEGRGRS